MAFVCCYKSVKIMAWKTVVQIVGEKNDIIYDELIDFSDGDLVYLKKDDRYVVVNIIFCLDDCAKVVVLDKE
jgi:hypothetical protein